MAAHNHSETLSAAEAARQEEREISHRLLLQVLESISGGVVLLDRDWRFTYVNAYANELAAPGRNLLGTSFREMLDEVGGGFREHYAEAMNHGRKVEFTEFSEPLKMWVHVRVFPMPDGIAIYFQDVTEQKATERTMRENAVRFRQALDAGQLGTWSWDMATDNLEFDERAGRLYGVEPPMTWTELRKIRVMDDDLSTTPTTLAERLASGENYWAEYRVKLPGDVIRWIAVSGVGLFTPDTHELTGISGTVQDVTVRKMQEAALRQSEKLAATGRLAATIAHEINNPLEAVTNLIYLCRTDPAMPAPIQRLLETADSELARISEIAQQTLGFYRDTARPVEIDVAALLASVVDVFSRKLLSKKLTCKLDMSCDLRIFGLQGEIKQVFSNLLVNAIDASAANTTILIRGKNVAQDGKCGVSILMVDEGSGIPEIMRGRMFSPFFTTKQSTGTGLGLWVTRGIVEKQGGHIGFRTRTEAPSGTIFRVFLPSEVRDLESFGAPQSNFLQ